MDSGNIEKLESMGLFVGKRDPKMNRAFKGRFMVCQPLSEGDPYPTDDASDGRFCIVGDDMDRLVIEAIAYFDGDRQ